eukprot:CAMPEP_0119130734 /NCGR_PEP_ID=MMETSP1310-20130426/8594_1 /TAXON_ID=464262 /ORGANISM="Genus nov. species nov., Strain RCC2339" /LENGTH=67 /DNA_ID=CAMNT_0007121263 /DNA_START=114 /DNA_END=317 /DNA_ORIENTATION=+
MAKFNMGYENYPLFVCCGAAVGLVGWWFKTSWWCPEPVTFSNPRAAIEHRVASDEKKFTTLVKDDEN